MLADIGFCACSELSSQVKKVIIIGGGPSGTACAIRLRNLAAETGKRLEVLVIEGKDFSCGEHYNQCVGVLSPPLPSLLEEELGVPFPTQLGRARISGYVLHTDREELHIEDLTPSVALRRVQFDTYMFSKAKETGVAFKSGRVVSLEIKDSGVAVRLEDGSIESDAVVGAFGTDRDTVDVFTRATGYTPPRCLRSVITKIHPGEEALQDFGENIHAFLPRNSQVEFGGITPKGDHLTINIAGRTVGETQMRSFLKLEMVSSVLGRLGISSAAYEDELPFFNGQFPCGIAEKYYGNRYVLVGDAAGLVRPFKGKGVTSAVTSGIRAANTIFSKGISHEAFAADYVLANQDIIGDLRYGKIARFLTNAAVRIGMLDPLLRAAVHSSELKEGLYGAVSGHLPYKTVLASVLTPRSIFSIVRRGLLSRKRSRKAYQI
jgi:flavin-dependent dehydrogenase